ATINDASFTADGARVLVTSDARGRPSRLLALDAATGTERARHDEPAGTTAALASTSISPTGDLAIIAVDGGDHSELRAFDPRSLRPLPAPALPLSSVELGTFDPDGRRM